MPQIGWFEIIIIVILAIIIVGPKDFPIILKKIGSWTNKVKNYFSEVQKDFTDIENVVDDEDFSPDKLLSDLNNNKKKDGK
jgi:sec-independent protein translocase protein TatB